jgi:DNA polymerase-3 subunit alpha
VNKRALESLVKSGALDSLDPDRGAVFDGLPALIEEAQAEVRRKESGQFSLFGGKAEEKKPAPRKAGASPPPPAWSRRDRLQYEKEALGFYITGHPLDSCAAEIAMYANATIGKLAGMNHGSEVKLGGIVASCKEKVTKKGEKMAILTFEDLEGTVEVTVFPRTYQECREILSTPAPVFLLGRIEKGEQGVKVTLDDLFPIENARERLAKSVHFDILLDRLGPESISELRKVIARNAGDKKGFLHVIRAGVYEAIIALPDGAGVSPSLELARELKNRFGYGVLRLHG